MSAGTRDRTARRSQTRDANAIGIRQAGGIAYLALAHKLRETRLEALVRIGESILPRLFVMHRPAVETPPLAQEPRGLIGGDARSLAKREIHQARGIDQAPPRAQLLGGADGFEKRGRMSAGQDGVAFVFRVEVRSAMQRLPRNVEGDGRAVLAQRALR